MDLDVYWTAAGALLAVCASFLIAADIQYAQKTECPEQRTMGAQVTTPTISYQNRQHHSTPEGKRGNVFEKIKHLDICNHIVRTVNEKIQGYGIHFQHNGPQKEAQQKVF
jgi:hypothetical protein